MKGKGIIKVKDHFNGNFLNKKERHTENIHYYFLNEISIASIETI